MRYRRPVSPSHGQDHDAIKKTKNKWTKKMDGPAVARPRHTHTKKKVKGKKNQKIERLYRRTINRVSGHIQSARWARNQATVSCTIRLGLPILPSSIPSTLRLLNFPWAFGPFFFFILTSSEGKKEKKKGQYSLRLAVVRLGRWKSYYIDLFLQFEFYRENEKREIKWKRVLGMETQSTSIRPSYIYI